MNEVRTDDLVFSFLFQKLATLVASRHVYVLLLVIELEFSMCRAEFFPKLTYVNSVLFCQRAFCWWKHTFFVLIF